MDMDRLNDKADVIEDRIREQINTNKNFLKMQARKTKMGKLSMIKRHGG